MSDEPVLIPLMIVPRLDQTDINTFRGIVDNSGKSMNEYIADEVRGICARHRRIHVV